MKKYQLKNYLKIGIVSCVVSLFLWNCEKDDELILIQENTSEILARQFNPSDFKEVITHKFELDLSKPKRLYSEQLETFFYEFPLIYKNNIFNPNTINKIGIRKYYIKYKIVAIEKDNKQFKFYIAKFFQEKDIKNPSLEKLKVNFNQNSGFKGYIQLYNAKGKLAFSKKISKVKGKSLKIYINENLTIKKPSLVQKVNENCRTITTYYYRDWYQYVYDNYGNVIGIRFLYSELIGTSTRTVCEKDIDFSDGLDIGPICIGDCIDSHAGDAIMCANGDPADENGNCEGEGASFNDDDNDSIGVSLETQRATIKHALSMNSERMDWLTNSENILEISQVYNFLNLDLWGYYPQNDIYFAELAIDAFITYGTVDFANRIINKLTNFCAKNIFTELENGIFTTDPLKPEIQIPNESINLNFAQTILKLFNDSDSTTLLIRNGDIGNSNAHTIGVSITLNNSYIESATQLSIARSIIHELVHTYLNGIYLGLPDFENKSFEDKMEIFAKDNGYIIGTNRFQHEFMGQFVEAMAYSLYEWDRDYGTGGNLGWDYYYAMGFAGFFQTDPNGIIVSETDAFKSIVTGATDRQKIADIIFNELKNNQYAKGTKCN